MIDVEALAMMADSDSEAIPVLGDAIIETKWATSLRIEFAMALCLGVPLGVEPPVKITTSEGRASWQHKRSKSLKYASEQWDVYAGSARKDWARAVLAVMLFGSWSPAKATPLYGSRCPWLLVWRNATWQMRLRRAEYKAHIEEIHARHAQEASQEVKSIARRYGAGT